MGDNAPRQRRGDAISAVLTPPTGVPTVPDLTDLIPTQRRAAEHGGASVAPPAPTPPPAEPVVDPCTCGHSRDAHEHYRRGRDCGVCGVETCARYRRRGGRIRRLMRRLHIVR